MAHPVTVARVEAITVFAVVQLWTVAHPGECWTQQADRHGRNTPGLVVETGGRTGACNCLTFSADGRSLLAAGDDKVVRIWPVAAGRLDRTRARILRWMTWRERRGAIHALALGGPRENRIAITGDGVRPGMVAILARADGEVLHGLPGDQTAPEVNWSVAFSPSGDQVAFGQDDGSVRIWDLKRVHPAEVRSLGRHGSADRRPRVRWLAFESEHELLSAAEDGAVLRWNTVRAGGEPALVATFKKATSLFSVAASPDCNWLAAIGENERESAPVLEVLSLRTATSHTIQLPARHFARCLAIAPSGRQLAVGMFEVPRGAAFQTFVRGPVLLYNLNEAVSEAREVARTTYYPEAVAFHPTEPYLAVAGGADHEVTIWALGRHAKAPASQITGPGKGLWSVGLAADNRYHLGFREHHAPRPSGPNRRGVGKWRVFDLRDHAWVRRNEFHPVEPIEHEQGWSVRPDNKDAYLWRAVSPEGKSLRLQLDARRYGMPRCYTFLKTPQGNAVRLAVGHDWGISVFELSGQTARRVRLFVGHQGEVTAVAPSADGKLLVSASRDQTLAAWSLEAYAGQPELGATFSARGGQLIVRTVAPGSPAWEAGLSPDDVIDALEVDVTEFLYDPQGKEDVPHRGRIKTVGSAEEAVERLRHPVPGKELAFLKRGSNPTDGWISTTVRQRPLWRFLPVFDAPAPGHDPEWVLWLWRDYYYNCSQQGDKYIGWQLASDPAQTPRYFPAEHFRERFHKPGPVVAATRDGVLNPERVSMARIAPPQVQLTVSGSAAEDNVRAAIDLKHDFNEVADPSQPHSTQVILWVNDFKYQTVDRPFKTADRVTFPVPRSVLRRGQNVLIAQSFHRDGHGNGRDDSARVLVPNESGPVRGTLYMVTVGIYDYDQARKASQKDRPLDLLFPLQDAKAVAGEWLRQRKGGVFDEVVHIPVHHLKATRANILAAFNGLRGRVKPNDRLLFFYSGHGYAEAVDGTPKNPVCEPGTFTFCPPDFHPARRETTGVTTKDLYGALAGLNCRKLILIDACHAGGLSPGYSDVLRELTPESIGPTILAASQLDAEAVEFSFDKGRHGVFTQALLNVVRKTDGGPTITANQFAKELALEMARIFETLFPDERHLIHHPRAIIAESDRSIVWAERGKSRRLR